MNESNGNHHDIDRLIAQTFGGEAAPDADERLRNRLQAFERRLSERESENPRSIPVRQPRLNPVQAWFHSFMGKVTFAAVSVSFIVLTFVVHEFGPKSAFACTIEAVQAAAASMDAVQKIDEDHLSH